MTKGSEILEVLHGLPKIKRYLFSLYDCHYSDFFLSLGELTVVGFLSKVCQSFYILGALVDFIVSVLIFSFPQEVWIAFPGQKL